MSIENQAAKHIVEAYLSQDINALDNWIKRFPEGWSWIIHHIGDLPLKNAIEKRQWRLIAYLIDSPTLPEKIEQIRMANRLPEQQLHCIIEGHFNKLTNSQFNGAIFFHERVLW